MEQTQSQPIAISTSLTMLSGYGVFGPGDHFIEFPKGKMEAERPMVLVALCGFHIGGAGGVTSCFAVCADSSPKGFTLRVGQHTPPSLTHVNISWQAFG